MPQYTLYIKGRGRGLRETKVAARSMDEVRKKANKWLEYGTSVTVKSPSGKILNFTVR